MIYENETYIYILQDLKTDLFVHASLFTCSIYILQYFTYLLALFLLFTYLLCSFSVIVAQPRYLEFTFYTDGEDYFHIQIVIYENETYIS